MTIHHHGKTVELVKFSESGRKGSRQAIAVGQSADGTLWYRGRTGRWSVAYQNTASLARLILSK